MTAQTPKIGIALKGPPPSIEDVWSYRELREWLNEADDLVLDSPVLMAPGDGNILAMKRPIFADEYGVHGIRLELTTEEIGINDPPAWWEAIGKAR